MDALKRSLVGLPPFGEERERYGFVPVLSRMDLLCVCTFLRVRPDASHTAADKGGRVRER